MRLWADRCRRNVGEAGEEGLGAAAVDGFGLAGGVVGVGLQEVVVVGDRVLRGEGPVAAVEDVARFGEGEQGGQGAGAGGQGCVEVVRPGSTTVQVRPEKR